MNQRGFRVTTFVASLLISLDGRNANSVSSPDLEELEEFNHLFDRSDSIVFDRADYELLIPFWDDVELTDPVLTEMEREFARIFRTKPRVVIAADLEQADSRTELIWTDPVAYLKAVKAQGDGTVLISAGAELLTLMLGHNLIDEIHVLMRPSLLGGDDSPLKGLQRHTALTLLESRALTGGSLVLRYRVLESSPATD